eukprot:CAMPEP_0116893622 /NCGR_PEP_ID=MMETSP0467-20121206/3561_1 /TAXON_ID=283647 /ORGANISM="Mesodinium pulex, Strain SPMC105" /LENGTH=65 /DNA_ID=CAMNT_0004563367 /DNA_START=1162 /DNA_END=1359 /DNA_ORIENTATION=+
MFKCKVQPTIDELEPIYHLEIDLLIPLRDSLEAKRERAFMEDIREEIKTDMEDLVKSKVEINREL